MLAFVGVEKTLKRKQAIIRERQREACEAKGKVWVEPELQIELEQKEADEKAEEAYREELKARCEKLGLDYDIELNKHIEVMRLKIEKRAEKERLLKQKEKEKEERIAKKQADKLSKMSLEQKEKYEARIAKTKERLDKAWEIEKAKGEKVYLKMQAMLNQYLVEKGR